MKESAQQFEEKPLSPPTGSRAARAASRYVAPDGSLERELPAFARAPRALVPLYRAMVLTRAFDEKAISLQRTGRLGTYASSLGEEAVAVGVASAMRAEDVLLPSFREHGAMLWRGVTPLELLLYWGGDERGSDFSGPRRDFPVSIPVASHAPHAAGVALAMQLRGEKQAAVSIMGDGATSKGDFYEAINVAGVWRLPAIFVIANNQWAISVPLARQTAAQTLADKAGAAGIASARVDGNDVVVVREAVECALARADAGEGPTLIEAVTYRLSDHTTADDATRYREDAEVSERWKEEPIVRLRSYLASAIGWSRQDEEDLIKECTLSIDAAVSSYLALPPLGPEAMFTHTYAELPADLERQREEVRRATGAPHA